MATTDCFGGFFRTAIDPEPPGPSLQSRSPRHYQRRLAGEVCGERPKSLAINVPTHGKHGCGSRMKQELVAAERIEQAILLIRGHRVMLSTHLAALYGVEPRALVQAVKRNRGRFPADFMFQLTREEFGNLKSQIVISSWGGLRRATPYAFTERGVAMLSSVLRSERAVQVNIAIMRAFVKLRELLSTHKDLAFFSSPLPRGTTGGRGAGAEVRRAV